MGKRGVAVDFALDHERSWKFLSTCRRRGGKVYGERHATPIEMGCAYGWWRTWSRQRSDSQERSVLRSGPRMENGRNRFRARGGVQLCAALVLVSGRTNSDFERHDACVSAAGLDLHARSHGRAQRLFGNGRRMAAVGAKPARFSARALERPAPFRKCILCGGHGKLCHRGSDRQFCFANVRRRTALPDYGQAGRNRVCRVPETHTKPHRSKFRIELWNPFLKNSGGWAQPRLC